MTQACSAAKREMAQRVLARRRLLPFIERMNDKYLPGWVHEDICKRLERFSDAVAAGQSPRLMLLMPPRAGKSEIASKTFPAWHLGRHPDHEIIACSYNVGLAMDFSKKIKALLEDPAYQSVFDIRLDPENKSSESWGLHKHKGSYVAAGVGGGINGKGAHILCIDDPIKNAEEADSPTTREAIWNWYGSTAYTRLAPGGGVLVVQCMTGDTPVLLPDGTQKRLDSIRAGDRVATYEDGRLTSAPVAAWKSNGRDLVYKITTSSGKIVRANGRHPFLVSDDGELKWVRTRSLTTASRIVALPDSGVSGKAKPVLQKDVAPLPYAEATARRTTRKKSGLMAIARRLATLLHTGQSTSNTATASPPKHTIASLLNRAANALSAGATALGRDPHIGAVTSASTTVTKLVQSGGYSVTDATSQSGTSKPSALPAPWPSTCEFTTERVVSVEPDGEEEVFDVQITRTENFIANGLVSHNTHWHDDDLAGRLQLEMANAPFDDPDVDRFEIIKYPAIAEHDEYLDHETDQIVYDTAPTNGLLLRRKGEALHPARFDIKKLLGIKRTIPARFWSALYQQNPTPDDGAYFTRDQFRHGALPQRRHAKVYIAWDFAISEKAHNDYTVGSVALQDADDVLHVAEVLRFKSKDAFFIVESILDLAKRWYHPSLQLGFEDGQIFRAIEALLKKRMRELKFYPSITVLRPITDKLARARALQGRMQQGKVSFAAGADWVDVVKNEMLRFPAGVHDDCVDSLAWMAQMAVGAEPPHEKKGKDHRSWRDKIGSVGRGGASHMAA